MLFLLLLFSCGGEKASEPATLLLKLSSQTDAPYYTKVELYINGPDTEPRVYVKEGRFLPGSSVVFEVDIPEGKERLFEAILYDHLSRPVYYGSLTQDSKKDSVHVLELFPSYRRLSFPLELSDSLMEQHSIGVEVFLRSEDLYFERSAGIHTDSLEGYLLGRYVCIKRDIRTSCHYLPSLKDGILPLRVEDYKSLEITSPADHTLYLSGSVWGFLYGSASFPLSSDRVSSQGIILTAFNAEPYLYVGPPTERVDLTVACPDACLDVGLQVQGLEDYQVEPAELIYRNIKARASSYDEPLRVIRVDGAEYILRVSRTYQTAECDARAVAGVLTDDLTQPVSLRVYTYEPVIKLGDITYLRVYDPEELSEFYMSCHRNTNNQRVLIITGGGGKLWVEWSKPAQGVSKRWGMLVDFPAEEMVNPDHDVNISLTPNGDHLLVRLERRGVSRCELLLENALLRLSVDYIPPHRSSLKIRLPEEALQSMFHYYLRCYTPDGWSFVEVQSFTESVF